MENPKPKTRKGKRGHPLSYSEWIGVKSQTVTNEYSSDDEVVVIDSPTPATLLPHDPGTKEWSSSNQCSNCGLGLSWGYRHHCRGCKKTICGNCSVCTLELTEEARKEIDPHIPLKTTVTTWGRRFTAQLVGTEARQGDPENRVCLHCSKSDKVKHKRNFLPVAQRHYAWWYYLTPPKHPDNLALVLSYSTLQDLYACLQVHSLWAPVANRLRANLRQLLYSIKPCHDEWDLMGGHRWSFPGHSRWMLQFLKQVSVQQERELSDSFDTADYHQETMRQAAELLDQHYKLCKKQTTQPTDRRRSCINMFCLSKDCVQDWTPLQALELLCLDLELTSANTQALKSLLRDIDSIDLECLLPALTNALVKSQKFRTSNFGTTIIGRLLAHSTNHDLPQVVSTLFWCLTYHGNRAVDFTAAPLARHDQKVKFSAEDAIVSNAHWSCPDDIEELIAIITRDAVYRDLVHGYAHFSFFLVALSTEMKCCGKKDDALVEHVRGIAANSQAIFKEDWPMYLPQNSEARIIGLKPEGVSVKSSQAKPVVLPFITEDNQTYKMLLKLEDLRLDQVALNSIKYADSVLKKELPHMDIPILTYGIYPITDNCGLIEMVNHAVTLATIVEKNQGIVQYLITANPQESGGATINRFILSTAAYTVLTFLLGVGDRHLDNVMLKDTGELFHIDFGFMFGQTTFSEKILRPSGKVRMTTEMLDAIGPRDGKEYRLYEETVSKIYNCLRKHYQVFLRLFLMAPDIAPTTFSVEAIQHHVATRFQVGQTDSVATQCLWQVLGDSSPCLTHGGGDWMHKHSREQTFGKALGAVGSTVSSWVSWYSNTNEDVDKENELPRRHRNDSLQARGSGLFGKDKDIPDPAYANPKARAIALGKVHAKVAKLLMHV
eukprot:TRINITY_DN60601_c0_g1_i1.p1 TRINITY_DN60601_c0_g1~~TRINITY_DN60601_c0_g1_i1.p1  ORF type:complete len:889 (+),score=37.07 TRINITY_DN60601_c0_g1_i1:36-2702(+)